MTLSQSSHREYQLSKKLKKGMEEKFKLKYDLKNGFTQYMDIHKNQWCRSWIITIDLIVINPSTKSQCYAGGKTKSG